MLITVIVFWLSFFLVFFCYIGYGLLLLLLNSFRSKKKLFLPGSTWPPVTLVITAYNEAQVLAAKMRNTFDLNYPASSFEVIVVTDGSDDGSDTLLAGWPGVRILHQPQRQGKMAALKRAMQHAQHPIVIFSDANTELNTDCIIEIVKHFSDPRTGAVAGEKKIRSGKRISAVGEAEGLYWQYESFMKKQDAAFHTVVGAAGELFALRKELFYPAPDHVILDDFVISMHVCLAGYTIAYEPLAYALEYPSGSLREEEKRKVRIAAGAYQCIRTLRQALNISRHPLLAFQYFSRRILRWVICPIALVLLFVTNMLLLYYPGSGILFVGTFVAQCVFYASALAGWVAVLAGSRAGPFTIPFYFVFMNYCLIKGFFLFTRGKHSVLWPRSARETPAS